MSVWIVLLLCWVLGSMPLAVIVGKVLARGDALAVAPDDLSVDVDAFLAQLFPAEAA